MTPTQEQVLDALGAIVDPGRGQDIVSAGMVQGLVVQGDQIGFLIEVDPARGHEMEPLRKAAEEAVRSVPGVAAVTAVLTAHSNTPGGAAPPPTSTASPFADAVSPSRTTGRSPRAKPGDKPLRPVPPPPNQGVIDGVDAIIAVASGKGGVGKSTVSVNLAVALAAEGKRVGLLDADVYGPSQPRMLGVAGRPSSPDGKTIIPLQNHGVTVMSMGFMVDEGQSVVWRGPMLMSALTQMLHQVDWGQLDYLIVDLPPGTGDVQLTLSQKAKVAGAVVVSTPQDIALIDARKALDMFEKVNTPVLGIIENMSTFVCPSCGNESHIFGHGGARREAERLGVPFLGEVPLDIDIRALSDNGEPIVAAKPESPQSERFRQIAKSLISMPIAAATTPA